MLIKPINKHCGISEKKGQNQILFLHTQKKKKKKAGEYGLEVKSNPRTLAEVFLPRCGQYKAPEGNSGNTDFAKK